MRLTNPERNPVSSIACTETKGPGIGSRFRQPSDLSYSHCQGQSHHLCYRVYVSANYGSHVLGIASY